MKAKTLRAGDRVRATVYGEEKTGVVVKDQRSGIVWVRWDGARADRWMHRESLQEVQS